MGFSLVTENDFQLFRQADFNFHVKACILSIIIATARTFARLKLAASSKTDSACCSKAFTPMLSFNDLINGSFILYLKSFPSPLDGILILCCKPQQASKISLPRFHVYQKIMIWRCSLLLGRNCSNRSIFCHWINGFQI